MTTTGLVLLCLLVLGLIAFCGHLIGEYFARRWIAATSKEIEQRLAAAKGATRGCSK